MKGKREEHFLLETGIDLLDDEAVLTNLQGELHFLDLVFELVNCKLVELGDEDIALALVFRLFDLHHRHFLHLIQEPLAQGDVD